MSDSHIRRSAHVRKFLHQRAAVSRSPSIAPGDEQVLTVPFVPFAAMAGATLWKPLNRIDPAKSEWTVIHVDGAHPGNPPERAIDDDPDSFWHTPWGGNQPPHPHELVVDLGREHLLAGFSALPRPDGNNGTIKQYRLYLSKDGEAWGEPISSGVLPSLPGRTTVRFSREARGRFLRLVAESAYTGPWTSLGELDVLAVEP